MTVYVPKGDARMINHDTVAIFFKRFYLEISIKKTVYPTHTVHIRFAAYYSNVYYVMLCNKKAFYLYTKLVLL